MASMEATLSADDMSAGPIELQTVISAILRQAMQIERIRFHSGPADIVREANEPLRGVFLTHLHLDHIGGMSEVPRDVPIFAGPGETTESHWKYLFT